MGKEGKRKTAKIVALCLYALFFTLVVVSIVYEVSLAKHGALVCLCVAMILTYGIVKKRSGEG